MHVTAVSMQLGINGVGNLFGLIPENAPAFDPTLAGEGRKLDDQLWWGAASTGVAKLRIHPNMVIWYLGDKVRRGL